jgi:hypothetical protein
LTDTQAVLDDIATGHHDDGLGQIVQAVFVRAMETETEFVWKITLGDDEWTRNTVTLAELAFAERHTGMSYVQLDPVRYADHLVALIIAHYRSQGMTDRAAIKRASAYTSKDLADIVSVDEAVPVPKDDSVASTPS